MNAQSTTHYRVGRLIVGDGSTIRADVILSVTGNRISSITPVAAFDPQIDVIDLGGATVLPGLIDAHIHLKLGGERDLNAHYFSELIGTNALKGLKRAQAALRNGFTTLRDVGGRDYTDISVRDIINAGEFAGPRLLVSGVPIISTGGHFDKAVRIPGVELSSRIGVADSPDAARKVARYQVKMGVDLLKIAADDRRYPSIGRPRSMPELSFPEMRAVVEVAEWAGMHVAVHSDGGPSFRNAVKAGARTIEHIQDLSADDAKFLADSPAFLVPTLTATFNGVRAGLAASGKTPERFAMAVANTEEKRRGMEQALKAGVKIALGTDNGYSFCVHGESAKELELLVECGMTPLEAITAASGTAADAIGLADELGTLTVGKLADFVVVDGDPLSDISILCQTERIAQVYKGGQLVAERGILVAGA